MAPRLASMAVGVRNALGLSHGGAASTKQVRGRGYCQSHVAYETKPVSRLKSNVRFFVFGAVVSSCSYVLWTRVKVQMMWNKTTEKIRKTRGF